MNESPLLKLPLPPVEFYRFFVARYTEMGMIDWSDLEQDLIGEIAKSVGSVVDFLVFSTVCPSWRLAAMKENRVSSNGLQFPWLVLAEKEDDNKNRAFFNLSNGKRYDLDSTQLRGRRLWGSSLGWIVTLDINLEFRLVNPLTQHELNLPHLYTLNHQPSNPFASWTDIGFSHLEPIEPRDSREWYMCYFIIRAIVFKRKNQIMVATMYGEKEFLAIARPGDECWTDIEKPLIVIPAGFIRDICFFNGELFAILNTGILLHCEFDEHDIPKLVPITPAAPPELLRKFYNKTYLVESMGDLLMVVRDLHSYPESTEFSYKTECFFVYKLDFEKKIWVELKNLGDNALFVGDSSTMSLCSSDVVGCERNVIYFTDDNIEQWDIDQKYYGGHDIGIYCLKENVVHHLPPNSLGFDDLRSTFCCPFWVMPSLF